MDIDPYIPPSEHLENVKESEEAPALWNPGAAVAWSFLFSPIFGAWIHMKNWQSLGDLDKASQSKFWIVGCFCYYVALIVICLMFLDAKWLQGVARGADFAIVLIWYLSIGKLQVNDIKCHFCKAYPRKRWGLPLLYATLGKYTFVILFVGLVLSRSHLAKFLDFARVNI